MRGLMAFGLPMFVDPVGHLVPNKEIHKMAQLQSTKSTFHRPRQELAVSRWGDVYELGRHYVACGTPHYIRKVPGDLHAKLCVIDPLASLRLSTRGEGDDGDVGDGAWSPNARLLGMAYDALDLIKSMSVPGAHAFVFSDWQHQARLLFVAETLGISIAKLLSWNHGDHVLSGLDRSSDELCSILQIGAGPAAVFKSNTARKQTSPVVRPDDDYPGSPFGQKPIELLVSILSNCTKRGDRVTDLCFAAGRALIAAELTDRVFTGVEENPRSVDLAIRSWEHMTGKSAKNLITGDSFDKRAQRISELRNVDHGK